MDVVSPPASLDTEDPLTPAVEPAPDSSPAPTDSTNSAPRSRGQLPLVVLYSLAAFVAAALVFLVQPMVAKMILPRLGGSPSVWNTALVFFQAVLLVGYGYAHFTTKFLPMRTQARVHIAVLALPLLVLPFSAPGWRPPSSGLLPLWVLVLLAVVAGAPYAAVTTASPLLQRWFSTTDHRSADDPYFLYAASNAGSLIGLLAYPVLVEPRVSLQGQARIWTAGYVVFLVIAAAAAFTVRRERHAGTDGSGSSAGSDNTDNTDNTDNAEIAPLAVDEPSVRSTVDPASRVRWVLLALVPSSLLIGTTSHITVDVASVPLLWIVPLSLYLLSFVVVFARHRILPTWLASAVLPCLVALIAYRNLSNPDILLKPELLLHLGAFFTATLVCHGRLADERPPADRLTEFFLLTSLGGVLGGVLGSLVAPLVFNRPVEYPLMLVAVLLARPSGRFVWTTGLAALLAFAAAIAVVRLVNREELSPFGTSFDLSVKVLGVRFHVALALLLVAVVLTQRRVLASALVVAVVLFVADYRDNSGMLALERSFFGSLSVAEDDNFRTLSHGTTLHGQQARDPLLRSTPTTYYSRSGPVGQAIEALRADGRADRIGVVGLGVGTIAAYGEPGRRITYFEIDKTVVKLASDPKLFTYLSDARAIDKDAVRIVLGDARLTLKDHPDNSFGLLALDAFSSDAIPVHLLTREAFAEYLPKLSGNGVLLVHISNRYLDLEPVVAATAGSLGLVAKTFDDGDLTEEQEQKEGKAASEWVAVARRAADLSALDGHGTWLTARTERDVNAWTDQSSSLWNVLLF